jgi:hypothetical protein
MWICVKESLVALLTEGNVLTAEDSGQETCYFSLDVFPRVSDCALSGYKWRVSLNISRTPPWEKRQQVTPRSPRPLSHPLLPVSVAPHTTPLLPLQ